MEIENKSRFSSGSLLRQERGQATVEYVLILVVTVTLVVGLAYQLFMPFQKFVQSSMGTYTRCLLETGEVPRLGGRSNLKEDASECGAVMGAAQTPPNLAVNSGGSGGSTSTGSNNGKNSNKSTAGAGDGGSGGSRGSTSINGSTGSPFIGSGTGDGPSNAAGNTKQIPIGSLPNSGSGVFRANGESVWQLQQRSGRQRVLGLSEVSVDDRAEIEKKEKRKTSGSRVAASEQMQTKPKKFSVKPPTQREIAQEDETTGFDFGIYFRYLIIILIILVLIIVLGSQAYRLSKSWEK